MAEPSFERGRPALEIYNLTYTYPNETQALEEINLTIRQGEYVALMGASGAGKTTLCLLLNGVIPHVTGGKIKGRINVMGLDTFDHHVYDLAQRVGMVLQDPEAQLFTSSVRSEVAFAGENLGIPRPQLIEQVQWALKTVRLEGLDDRVPSQLSGGQKQRLAIASSLVVRPQLIVLDEPTSQLDPLGSQEVFSVLSDLNRELGLTVFIATHKSEEVAAFADRIILLDGGRIATEGRPDEVLAQVELLDRLDVKVPAVTQVEWELRVGSEPDRFSVTLQQSKAKLQGCLEDDELVVRERPSIRDDEKFEPAQSLEKAVIDIKDLSYTYETSAERALDGIDLEIWPGEFVGLVGQNGAGKSTLAKIILGLLHPTKGKVLVGGEDVTTKSAAQLSRQVGLVLQNPDTQLFALSAREEVDFGLQNCGLDEDEVERRIEEALKAVGLWEKRDQYPFNFSYGDRRKLSVAAVAAMRPQTLIFDEPSTGQDHLGRYELANIARDLNRAGTTVIMISHDMDLIAEYSARLIVMGKGRIIADGPTRSVFQDVDLLGQTFISPPQITRLAQSLQIPGLRSDVLTTTEFCDLFLQR